MLVKINGSDRVRRGGSWLYNADGSRVAYRVSGSPDYRYYSFGFRISRRCLYVDKNRRLWNLNEGYGRVTNRYNISPDYHNYSRGFRISRRCVNVNRN